MFECNHSDSGSGRNRKCGVSVYVHVHTGTRTHKENNLHEDACLYLYFLSSFSISIYLEHPSLIVRNQQPFYLMWYSRQEKKGGGSWIKLWENGLAVALLFCSYKRARKAEISLGSAFFISKPVMAIVCCRRRLCFRFPATHTWKIPQKLH